MAIPGKCHEDIRNGQKDDRSHAGILLGRIGFVWRNAFVRNSDAGQLGDLRGPQAANINSVSGHAVIDEPVSRMKPAMATESPALGSDGVHIREVFQRWQLFEYRLPVPI